MGHATNRLGAILLNPPTTSGLPTQRHLAAAAQLFECGAVDVANMYPLPTRSVIELDAVASDRQSWLDARSAIIEITRTSQFLIAGWGLGGGLTGSTRENMQEQRAWFCALLASSGTKVWMVGGAPRHPSRWHQYVSDKHGRTSGGSLAERLRQVLREHEPMEIA